MKISQGAKFRQALKDNNPLQIVGAINAYCAMLAQDAGHKAIYLSGGGVANASYGLPEDVRPLSLNPWADAGAAAVGALDEASLLGEEEEAADS